MTLNEVNRKLFSLLRSYFPQTHIAFAEVNQVKGHIPALTIRAGNLKRALFPITREINGVPCDCWVQQYPVELNLMTNGRQVSSDGFSYNENTAVSDLVDLINFLGSPYAKEWCLANDISIQASSTMSHGSSEPELKYLLDSHSLQLVRLVSLRSPASRKRPIPIPARKTNVWSPNGNLLRAEAARLTLRKKRPVISSVLS